MPAPIRITHNGETKSIAGWARSAGLKQSSLWRRLRQGWEMGRALATPIDPVFAPNRTVTTKGEAEAALDELDVKDLPAFLRLEIKGAKTRRKGLWLRTTNRPLFNQWYAETYRPTHES